MGEPRDVVNARLQSIGDSEALDKNSSGLQVAAVAFFVHAKSLADSAEEGGITIAELEQLVRAAAPRLTARLAASAEEAIIPSQPGQSDGARLAGRDKPEATDLTVCATANH